MAGSFWILTLKPDCAAAITSHLSVGMNSLAVKLFLRGEHKDIFVPVYPTEEGHAKDIKVWEIRYPPDIETDEKYLATEPEAADKK